MRLRTALKSPRFMAAEGTVRLTGRPCFSRMPS